MYQNKRVLQESELKIPSWSSCKKNPTATFTALLKNSRNAVPNTQKNYFKMESCLTCLSIASYDARGTRDMT